MSVSSDRAFEAEEVLAPVTILVIDDDEHWAWATEQLLEHEDGFSVATAHSLSAGRDRFEALDPDCVVCDYDLGDGTGLELLDTVRAVDSDRPFVLVTGKGDEGVASTAIERGVTDYIRKGQDDEDDILASRIRNAVDTHRTERRVAAVHRRSETIHDIAVDLERCDTRQSVYDRAVRAARDVLGAECCDVLVAREGTVTGVSRVGSRPSTSALTSLIEAVVRPCLEASTIHLERAWDGPAGPMSVLAVPVGPTAVLLATVPGADRFDAYDQDVAEILVSHVTAALDRLQSRERLERERDSKEVMRALLTSTASRTAVERIVCERLVEVEGFRLAWIGDYTPSAGVSVREAVGSTAYLSDVSLVSPDGETPAEPGVRAADEATSVTVSLAEAPEAPWVEAARDEGVSHVVAEPLVYRDVLHGVLVAYAEAAVDGPRRRLLGEYAESLATAVADAKRDQSLGAETATELAVQVRDGSAPLVALARGLADRDAPDTLTVRGAVPQSAEVSCYLRCHDTDPAVVREVATDDACPAVTSASVLEDTGTVELVFERPTVLGPLFDHGGVLQDATVADGTATITAEFGRHVDVRTVAESVQGTFDRTTVTSLCDVERDTDDWTRSVVADLTDKQLEAVKTAYLGGYFERPRERDATAVAEDLDVSRQAFLQHLRVAQCKTFAQLFDGH